MPESSQRPSSVPLCNLRADQCYGHSDEEATSQIAPQSPTENSKIRISAAPGVSFGSAATGHLSRSLRWLRVFTQFPPARSWPRSLPHHAPANIVHYTPSVIRPSWRQKSAPLNVRCCGVASVQTRQYVLNRRSGFLPIRRELMAEHVDARPTADRSHRQSQSDDPSGDEVAIKLWQMPASLSAGCDRMERMTEGLIYLSYSRFTVWWWRNRRSSRIRSPIIIVIISSAPPVFPSRKGLPFSGLGF